MDGPSFIAETPKADITKVTETAPSIVFQPQKLKEIVEVVDLMGTVAARVREDNSGDIPGATGGGGQSTGQKAGTSARDEAIAKAPPIAVMQKKLVEHLEREVRTIEKQAASLKRSNARGSGYLLSELYRKIRRLRSLISDILHASAEMIKRFYISAFIDHQPLVVTGGSLAGTDQ